MVTTAKADVSKGKTTSTKRKSNGGVWSTRKTCQIGQQVKVPKIRIREQEDLPCGSNAPSVVVERGFEYKF
ncbi:hypothetical protein HanXRQr2_Chr02g0081251 [Helianthus annuus]|uniref:Uncharacterized protein n=1 Tax=Helianthus annuus TaxID=4232 RepID=A0A9K3JSF9_HELAN|nr:hypothetical protein HanXRQr2_Chr02g0081251 [Helianthus annuus]